MNKSIFDDINSTNIGSYWTTLSQQTDPYLWETLMPNSKQIASDFVFYRGMSNAPKPLAPSAFGVPAIMRKRSGFDRVSDHTRYFKEGYYIDEAIRQQLLRVGANATQAEKDMINNHIFQDSMELLKGAQLTREIMRNQIIQTGKINVIGNGQTITADYQMKASHRVVNDKAWGTTGSTPFEDIQKARDLVGDDSDQVITRAVMNKATFNALMSDTNVKSTMLYDNGKLANVTIPQSELLNFLVTNYGLTVQIYDKRYMDIDGTKKKWIPDGRVIFLPDGELGKTIMSTTPEEADLAAASDVDMTLVDNGVAITTMLDSDPVNKKINVSQEVMPSFPQIDGIYILDAFAKTGTDPLATTPTAPASTTTTTDPKA
ncbi:major capsid protein [Levilactobacillus brevis]|uniref:major capsid protein n=1 Tax=Levilactobacillus brevis TaxID=1580 RepID=UPI0035A3A14C